MANKATGKFVERCGQYNIHQWTGEGVDSGDRMPFSCSLPHSFDWVQHPTLEAARDYAKAAPVKRSVRVTFSAYIPVHATDEQIEDWISYKLHENGSLDRSNPLSEHALEGFDVFVDSD